MPLYEYACRSCGHRFEFLTRSDRTPACPGCAGTELDKQLSVFAVNASTSKGTAQVSAGPCGTCGDPRGPGACSLN
jgi:putative FmdB family regulatory protein